jgi:hypothetical protein
MADNTDLLNQFRQIVREENEHLKKGLEEQGTEIKAIRGEHGEKLDKLDAKVDRVEDGQNRQHTVLKSLQGTIEETKAEVDKILRRPRQAD